MSRKQSFERSVDDDDDDMHHDGQPGRAPTQIEDADMAMKKGRPSSHYPVDEKSYHKKDCPPRFSTIFDAAPAPPPPPPPRPLPAQPEYIREYYPAPQRKSGVFMPMPLFVVFAVILFMESTILFAYTVIGLYNNAPAKLFPWAGQGGAVAAACNCGPQQPAVNIAPNFIMPQAGQPLTELITITPSTAASSTTSTTSTSSTSTSTSSSSTTSTTTNIASVASNIAGIIGGLGGVGSLTSVTVSPTQSTITSVKLITEDPSGNVLTPRPTVTRTTFVDPPKATDGATDSQASASASTADTAAAWASISTALAAAEAALTPSPLDGITVTPTTLHSSPTPAPTS